MFRQGVFQLCQLLGFLLFGERFVAFNRQSFESVVVELLVFAEKGRVGLWCEMLGAGRQ